MRKIIAVDIDDVIADSTDALRVSVNKKLGVELEEHHYRIPGEYWGYYEHVWQTNGVADKIKHEELEMEMRIDQSHILPKLEAIETLTKLSEFFDIVLITARDENLEDATRKWLESHLGTVYRELHIIGSHKTKEKPRSKGEVCNEVGASWLIDDNPQHCQSAIEHGVDAILFGNYGWHHDAPDHLVTCRDWSAVMDYFDEIRR